MANRSTKQYTFRSAGIQVNAILLEGFLKHFSAGLHKMLIGSQFGSLGIDLQRKECCTSTAWVIISIITRICAKGQVHYDWVHNDSSQDLDRVSHLSLQLQRWKGAKSGCLGDSLPSFITSSMSLLIDNSSNQMSWTIDHCGSDFDGELKSHQSLPAWNWARSSKVASRSIYSKVSVSSFTFPSWTRLPCIWGPSSMPNW